MNYNYLKAYYPSEYGYADFGRARTFKGILRWAGGRARKDTKRIVDAVSKVDPIISMPSGVADMAQGIKEAPARTYDAGRRVRGAVDSAISQSRQVLNRARQGIPTAPTPIYGGTLITPAPKAGSLVLIGKASGRGRGNVGLTQNRTLITRPGSSNQVYTTPVQEPVVNAAAKPAPHAPDDPITASAPAKKAADQGQGVKTRKEFPLKPTLIGLGGVALAGGGGYGAYRMTRVNVPAKGGRKGYSYERRVSAKRGKFSYGGDYADFRFGVGALRAWAGRAPKAVAAVPGGANSIGNWGRGMRKAVKPAPIDPRYYRGGYALPGLNRLGNALTRKRKMIGQNTIQGALSVIGERIANPGRTFAARGLAQARVTNAPTLAATRSSMAMPTQGSLMGATSRRAPSLPSTPPRKPVVTPLPLHYPPQLRNPNAILPSAGRFNNTNPYARANQISTIGSGRRRRRSSAALV